MKLRRAELKKARIEIIPMIDTIFFLLVFFMMSSLQMTPMSAYKVNLPESDTAQARPVEKIVLSVSKEGGYYIDRRQVSYRELLPLLAGRVKENPEVVVVLNVDRDQQVGQLQGVMDVAKQANPGKLMIATAPREVTELRQ